MGPEPQRVGGRPPMEDQWFDELPAPQVLGHTLSATRTLHCSPQTELVSLRRDRMDAPVSDSERVVVSA